MKTNKRTSSSLALSRTRRSASSSELCARRSKYSACCCHQKSSLSESTLPNGSSMQQSKRRVLRPSTLKREGLHLLGEIIFNGRHEGRSHCYCQNSRYSRCTAMNFQVLIISLVEHRSRLQEDRLGHAFSVRSTPISSISRLPRAARSVR